MRFLLLCCFNEADWEALPEAERDRIMRAYGDWIRDVEKRGQHVATGKLLPTDAAVTVSHQNGKPAISDGPFAETKEQLGGYHLIECSDRDEAVSIAGRIPTLSAGGRVEVRQLAY